MKLFGLHTLRCFPLSTLKRGIQTESRPNSRTGGQAAPGSMRNGTASLLLLVVFAIPNVSARAAEQAGAELKPAKLHVAGYGLFGNLELKRLLRLLDTKGSTRE